MELGIFYWLFNNIISLYRPLIAIRYFISTQQAPDIDNSLETEKPAGKRNTLAALQTDLLRKFLIQYYSGSSETK